MQTVVVLALIFAGVAFAVYQVYDIYYSQNFGDAEKRAESSSASGESASAHENHLRQLLGEQLASAAMNDPALSANPEPLVRRRRTILLAGANEVRIRYLPFWTGKPVSRDYRQPLLIVVLCNCLLAMFLGGLSLYTMTYRVPGEAFAWMNDETVILAILAVVVFATHVLSKLDLFLHDIYQIGQLNRRRV
ncbi:hypothetical protein [Salinicola avicenniae]|uniref:hypothetical protein n=1 Tax=Salinicola avicenniae TaxID=2916836 RepID=UPI002073011A|nr:MULTISPECIES: hypothetical protein [unclassified Salinicola]